MRFALVLAVAPAIAIVFDQSASMTSEKWNEGLNQALSLVVEAPLEDAWLKVWGFDEGARVWPYGWARLPSKEVRDNVVKWLEETGTGGSTDPRPAISKVLREDKHPLAVVLVTDGMFDVAALHSRVEVLQSQRRHRAKISVVLVGDATEQDKVTLRKFTDRNEGWLISRD